MAERVAVRKRRRLPEWANRLGSGGVGEALAAAALFLFSEVFFGGTLTTGQLLVDLALALSAGASGRWALAGGIGVGLSLSAMAFVHDGGIPLVMMCMFIPVVSAGVRGLTRLRDLFALWYVATTVLLASMMSATAEEAFQSTLIMGALMFAGWGVSRTVLRLRREGQRLRDLRLDSLKAQRRSIARDLHDTVAYATTTMIMRAEEIKLRTADDPALVSDLDFIISTGRRSVRDLRGMLEALRRNDPSFDVDPVASAWRVVSVPDVLESRTRELAEYGLTLQTVVDADLDALPGSVRETLAKLVVEATSNMVKHASPGPCQVLIEARDDTLEVVFTNRATTPQPPAPEGLGLLGATERVEALGGELEATHASSTWIVRAQLPIGGQ